MTIVVIYALKLVDIIIIIDIWLFPCLPVTHLRKESTPQRHLSTEKSHGPCQISSS